MADIPPTPLLPTKIGGWGVDDQSLLMEQGPIFGDESMMEMTFEMSRFEDGQGELDHWNAMDERDGSTDTIVMPVLNEETITVAEDHGDWEVEAAREAGADLERREPSFFAVEENEDAAHYAIDHDDYYGEYPPSPFLDRSMWKPRQTAEFAQSITLPLEDFQSPRPPHIEISFNQADVESPGILSKSLEAIVPGEATFTAHGDKPTWAEEERSHSLESSRSRKVSPPVDGSANGRDAEERESRNGVAAAKRPASSPRQAQEKKKSRQRSPSQDDYYSRRLSRSVSANSMVFASPSTSHADLPSSDDLKRSSLISQNAVAGPSRIASAPRSLRKSAASPPIHCALRPCHQIPSLPSPTEHEDEEVLPPRPSFLSRLIARSSVLHPASNTSRVNSSSTTTSGPPGTDDPSPSDGASAPQSISSENASIIHEHDDVEDVETARSRRMSGTSSVHPTWDKHHVLEEQLTELFGDTPSRLPLSRGSINYDRRSLEFSLGQMSAVGEQLMISPRYSAPSLPMDPHLDRSTAWNRSRYIERSTRDSRQESSAYSGVSHSPNTSARRDVVHTDEAVHCDASSSSNGSQSLQTSTTTRNDSETSLRRSTSQRVIGFFSDLLRTSTSSRPESDRIQTPRPIRSVSAEEETNGNEISVEDVGVEEQEVSEEQAYQQDDRLSRRQWGETRPQYSADAHFGSHILPLPRYIPLTRPNKAPISHTAARAANPVRRPRPIPSTARPTGTSSFASAALARLPPPGKGCSSAGEKIVVKPLERATNLQARRALFEKSKNQPVFPVVPGKENPQTGLKSDKGISARLEEKRKLREAEERKKRMEEDRAYRDKRKETIVKARPVPDMYRRKLH